MISVVEARWRSHYHLANLFLRLRRYDAAANAFGRALRLRPGDPHLEFQRAWSLLEVPHRRLESITAFENLMKSSPSAGGYYLMALGLQKEDRHEEAIEAFREAERLEPSENADCHYNYAISLTAVGRLEEAADAYQTAAHLNPFDGEAWGNLGTVFADLGQWKEAAPCQERAMRLAPSLMHGLSLVDTLGELNRVEEAERVVQQCLDIDPRSTDAREAFVKVLTWQDRYEEALPLARELCAVTPVPPSSRIVLAFVLMEAGRLEEALREAAAAGEADPSHPGPPLILGGIYVKMNDGRAALEAFERFGRLQSDLWGRVRAALGRGNALSVLERHDEAMSAFEEALRLDPGLFERWPEWTAHYDRSSRETGRQRSHA